MQTHHEGCALEVRPCSFSLLVYVALSTQLLCSLRLVFRGELLLYFEGDCVRVHLVTLCRFSKHFASIRLCPCCVENGADVSGDTSSFSQVSVTAFDRPLQPSIGLSWLGQDFSMSASRENRPGPKARNESDAKEKGEG